MEGLPRPSTVSNLYERLGLPVEATQEEIVAALKVLGPIWSDPWLKFEREYRAIQDAYIVLINPGRRQNYDAALPKTLEDRMAERGFTPEQVDFYLSTINVHEKSGRFEDAYELAQKHGDLTTASRMLDKFIDIKRPSLSWYKLFRFKRKKALVLIQAKTYKSLIQMLEES